VFVTAVGGRVTWALRVTSWVDFLNCGAIWVFGLVDVMSTNWHSVRITSGSILKVSSSNNSGALEPGPWGTYLTSITSLRETVKESTTSGSVGSGQFSVEGSVSLNAQSVVISFGGSVSPT